MDARGDHPGLLVLGILPEETLRIFGPEFANGASALRILIIGMIVPVMVGTVGFILIMWRDARDGISRCTSPASIDIGVALVLAGPSGLGIRGAASRRPSR